jgi:uncharacterized protein (DUF488 family)
MSDKINPDILIYIQNLKNAFEKDEEIKNYFINDINNYDLFFKLVLDKSLGNDDDYKLTSEQFESIRYELYQNNILNNKLNLIFVDKRGIIQINKK